MGLSRVLWGYLAILMFFQGYIFFPNVNKVFSTSKKGDGNNLNLCILKNMAVSKTLILVTPVLPLVSNQKKEVEIRIARTLL